MTHDIIIEKGISIPERKSKKFFGITEKLVNMEVGDSFLFQEEAIKSIYPLTHRVGKINHMKFTIRKISDTHRRCWRIE
jgi:hypothetical protein